MHTYIVDESLRVFPATFVCNPFSLIGSENVKKMVIQINNIILFGLF